MEKGLKESKGLIAVGLTLAFMTPFPVYNLWRIERNMIEKTKAVEQETVVKPQQNISNEIHVFTCGHASNPVTQKDMEFLKDHFESGPAMEGNNQSFEIWHNKDKAAVNQSVVVARYPNGQVCFAPQLK